MRVLWIYVFSTGNDIVEPSASKEALQRFAQSCGIVLHLYREDIEEIIIYWKLKEQDHLLKNKKKQEKEETNNATNV